MAKRLIPLVDTEPNAKADSAPEFQRASFIQHRVWRGTTEKGGGGEHPAVGSAAAKAIWRSR
jgi:hypothetical protein